MQMLLKIGINNAFTAVVLALIVFCITRVSKHHRAAHVLWILVLIKLVTPPLIWVPIPALSIAASIPDAKGTLSTTDDAFAITSLAADETLDSDSVAPRDSRPITAAIAWVWLVGILLTLSLVVYRVARFQQLIRSGIPLSDQDSPRAIALAARVGLAFVPEVRVVTTRIGPMVWPIGRRSIVLLPQRLLDSLTSDELAMVMAHEFVHIKRRDNWVRILEVAVGIVYWWHPLVWWARRGIHTAEEECCDGDVLRLLPDKRHEYGAALLHTAEFLSGLKSPPRLASVFGQTPNLKGRIEMILDNRFRKPLALRSKLALVLFSVAVLPMATLVSADDKTDRGQANKLNGDWEVERTFHGGVERGIGPDEFYKYYRWRFDAKRRRVITEWKGGDNTGFGENYFKLDNTTTPNQLTIRGDKIRIQAVYEFVEDDLKIAFFGKAELARPKSFEDQHKDAGPLVIFHLKKLDKKK